MDVDRRFALGSKAAHENVGLGVHTGLLFGDLSPIDQRLHVRMIRGSFDKLITPVVVNPGVAGMNPMAGAARIDQKSNHCAVRFFFGRNSGQLDDGVRFLNQLH